MFTIRKHQIITSREPDMQDYSIYGILINKQLIKFGKSKFKV